MKHTYTKLEKFAPDPIIDDVVKTKYTPFVNALTRIIMNQIPSNVKCDVANVVNDTRTIDESGFEKWPNRMISIHEICFEFVITDNNGNAERNKSKSQAIARSLYDYFANIIIKAHNEVFNDPNFGVRYITVEEDEHVVSIYDISPNSREDNTVDIDCLARIPVDDPICSEPNTKYFTTAWIKVLCNAHRVTPI